MEQQEAPNGQGRPALEHVLHIGRKHRITKAAHIVAEVRHAVAQWPALAQQWQVTSASSRSIQAALAKIDQGFKNAAM